MGCKLMMSHRFLWVSEGTRNKQEESMFHINTDTTLRGCGFSKKEQRKQQFQLDDNRAFHF